MLWGNLLENAQRIFEALERKGFISMRVLADGEIVVSSYLVSSAEGVVRAARDTAPYYPHIRSLEVQGVRADSSGAITKTIVKFEARPMILEQPEERRVGA
jgi:hypothetical protein